MGLGFFFRLNQEWGETDDKNHKTEEASQDFLLHLHAEKRR